MTKKLEINVLQVVPALEQGGVERGTLELGKYINSKGWKSFVASEGGRLVKQLETEGSTHIELPLKPRTPWNILFNAFKLAKTIDEHNIQIVHARSRAPAWSAYLACKFTNTPFVTTFHGTYSNHNAFKRWYNSVMLKGKHVIAISDFIHNHILSVYGTQNCEISVVPRGCDEDLFSIDTISKQAFTNIAKKYHISNDKPIILMPGRITRWKGQKVLLEALFHVRHLEWNAVFVGDAGKGKHHFLAELQQYALDKKLADRVYFVGNQQHMPELYAFSDIAISASTDPEAFGRVAIESQFMKTPIIASAHGGSLETVKNGETGWLVPPSDAKMLAQAIKEALQSPENLKKMGEAAYTWSHENFTTQKMCEGEFNAYKNVLGI